MPLPLTVSCFSKIQIGFTFLVPAHLGSPGQRAVQRVCVCVCACEAAYRSTRISVLTTSKKINLMEVECFPECILTDNRMPKQSDKLEVNFSGGRGHHSKSRHPPTTHRPNLETSTRSSKSQPSGSSSSATTSVAFANLCYINVLNNNNNIFMQC